MVVPVIAPVPEVTVAPVIAREVEQEEEELDMGGLFGEDY